jgi:hypothetical protein
MISDEMVRAAAAARIRVPEGRPVTGESDGETVGAYLRALFATLWRRGEKFSAKRPFGYSGWQADVYLALVEADLVAGVIDPDGYLAALDEVTAQALVQAIIARGLGPVDSAGAAV